MHNNGCLVERHTDVKWTLWLINNAFFLSAMHSVRLTVHQEIKGGAVWSSRNEILQYALYSKWLIWRIWTSSEEKCSPAKLRPSGRCEEDICHNIRSLLAVCHPLISGGLQPAQTANRTSSQNLKLVFFRCAVTMIFLPADISKVNHWSNKQLKTPEPNKGHCQMGHDSAPPLPSCLVFITFSLAFCISTFTPWLKATPSKEGRTEL